jgi:cytoskeleton protein RodZ
VITLTAESWLSVQDAMRSLVSELHPAGQTLTIKGQAPFQVNIGNAPAVSMTINGKPVDLRPHTKGAVATLTVRP